MRPRSISNPLFVQPKTWSMDIDVSLSFFISSFFPRSFFRKSSSSSSSSPSFLLHARNKTCSLEKEEEERKIGLSFLTTSWKSRCLNRRVEFFSFLSLFSFAASFRYMGYRRKFDEVARIDIYIHIEIVSSTR